MRAKQRNNLTIGHLLMIVRVNPLQKLFNLALVREHAHANDEGAEFNFIDDTISVVVTQLERIVKFLEETLVLPELKVQHNFNKLLIVHFAFLLVYSSSAHLSASFSPTFGSTIIFHKLLSLSYTLNLFVELLCFS